MRILLVQNLVYVPSHGGANKANRLLLEGLAARGHDCRAVALATAAQGAGTRDAFLSELASRGIRVTASVPGVDVFRADGVEVHAVSDPARLLPAIAEQAAAFAPDCVVLSHAGPAQALLETALDAAPGRLVYLAHTTLWLPFGPGSFHGNPTEAALLRRATAVVAVSRFGRDYLRRWGGLDSEVLAFPMFGPGSFPDLGRFGEGAVTMVNPSSVKGISIFLDLAARFPDLPFAAVPTYRTTRADREALEALPNVELWPATDDVDALLARVRILLMPSLWDEAFGAMAIEAMLRGIPVLASDTGGLPEAKLGVEYVLPVRRIERYVERFDDRHEPIADVPAQDLGPWEAALRELTTDRGRYERISRDSRAAALAYVGSLGWEPFEDLFRWVAERAGQVSPRSASPTRPARALADLSPERRELIALLLLERRQGLIEDAGSPLVAIDPDGSRRPLFLVHPAAGTVDCYVALARHLDPEQPLYAFQAAGVGGRGEPCDRVETMAARYVEALRKRQPHGPYLLGGWSLGAIVAFEMAKQLRESGEEIALLALLDSHPPLAPGEAGQDPEDDDVLLARWASELGVMDAEGLLQRLRELRLLPATAGPDNLRHGLRVYRAHRRAVLSYRPTDPYPGRLTLFHAGPVAEDDLGWGRLSTEPVAVRPVPGGHYEMLSEPQVRVLAEAMEGRLRAIGPHPVP
jgi:thioesterase domain-containing protein/glycosyltransferase involved in cell wall biosynthesis